ncbi:MAG: antitoxin Xre-like helix-turn-helix domain-containing protein [Pseudomonadota bacterium]
MSVIELKARQPKTASTVPQNFAAEADRVRFTDNAVKAIVRIASAWAIGNEQAAMLLGVSPSTWDRMKAGRWQGTLSQDQLTRASALIGIFKGLHLLFVGDLADRWPLLANKGDLFAGVSPVEAMAAGGIPHMIETRQHIDALCGGL